MSLFGGGEYFFHFEIFHDEFTMHVNSSMCIQFTPPVSNDIRYLKSPELFEERIEASADLLALDDEFRETYQNFLERIFFLFDGIVKYYSDVMRYLEDLQVIRSFPTLAA